MSLCHETLSILRDLDRRMGELEKPKAAVMLALQDVHQRVMELEKTTASLKRRCELLEVVSLRQETEKQVADTQRSWEDRLFVSAQSYRAAPADKAMERFDKLVEIAREAP